LTKKCEKIVIEKETTTMQKYSFRAVKVYVNAFYSDDVVGLELIDEDERPAAYRHEREAQLNAKICQDTHEAVLVPMDQFVALGGDPCKLTEMAEWAGSGQ
jgi:hypothetical protein